MMKRADLVEWGKYLINLSMFLSIVEFKMPTDAQRAVRDMHDSVLGGRRIFIRMVKQYYCLNLFLNRKVSQAHTI